MSNPVVLITFAGRERRLKLLSHYVNKALQEGLIDEWHIWDFTREESDTFWLAQEFKSLAFISEPSPYQNYGSIFDGKEVEFSCKCSNDFHFAFTVGDFFYECAIGAWSNTRTIVRKVSIQDFNSHHRSENNCEVVWDGNTIAPLSSAVFKKFNIVFRNNNMYFYIDGICLFHIEDINLDSNSCAYVRGGYGGAVEFDNKDRVKRFAGVPKEAAAYYRAYKFYSQRYEEYKNHVFLKCDDDIVYIDYQKLKGFIDFRKLNSDYFLVSANVLNNGYCAFLQQEAGNIPLDIGYFEMPQADDIYLQTKDIELSAYTLGKVNSNKFPIDPVRFEGAPYGFHGSLWSDGQKAIDLHNYFLTQDAKTLHFSKPIVEWPHYVSINFVSWLGRDLRHMQVLQRIDDERAFSLDVPSYLNRKHAFYSDFMVSHLSFAHQETHHDFEETLQKYEALVC